MRTPSLRQIEAFMAFVKAGTVVGAAELLCISQPAASMLLSHLEDDTGLKLFERDSGRLIVTDRGMRLHKEIDRIFSGIHQIERAVDQIRREDEGRLRIGIVPGLSSSFTRRVVTGLVSQRPGVYVSVSARNSQIIVDWLVRGQLDVGLTSTRIEHPGVEIEALESNNLVCVLPLAHPLAQKTTITLQDLANEPIVAPAPGEFTRLLVDETFANHGMKPNIVLDATSALILLEFVTAGVGVALMHPLLADAARGQVAIRPFEPFISSGFFLCWPRDARNPSLVDAFIAQAREIAAESSLAPS